MDTGNPSSRSLTQSRGIAVAGGQQFGVQYLLDTQLPDGSWFVATRSHQTQIFFESGFPHGASQFISAAATNWATQALMLSDRGRPSTLPPSGASR